MTVVRVDPWDAEYGASAVDLRVDEAPQTVEFGIEEDIPWEPVAPPSLHAQYAKG